MGIPLGLAVNKPGVETGDCQVDRFAPGSGVALPAAAPALIGNTGNKPAVDVGVERGALVLGSWAADGSGGMVAACKPDEGLLGGGACEATAGRLSVSHEGGPLGSAGGVLVAFAGSSPEAVTTANA